MQAKAITQMQQQLAQLAAAGVQHRPHHPYNTNNRGTTPAKTIAMDDTDEEAAVAMVLAAADEVQAAAEPVVVGTDC